MNLSKISKVFIKNLGGNDGRNIIKRVIRYT